MARRPPDAPRAAADADAGAAAAGSRVGAEHATGGACGRGEGGLAAGAEVHRGKPVDDHGGGGPGGPLRRPRGLHPRLGGFRGRGWQAGTVGLEAGAGTWRWVGRLSLAASLDHGFRTGGSPRAERAQLAVLHLFRDSVDVDVLAPDGGPGHRRGRTWCRSWPVSPGRTGSGPVGSGGRDRSAHRVLGTGTLGCTRRCPGTSPTCSLPMWATPAATQGGRRSGPTRAHTPSSERSTPGRSRRGRSSEILPVLRAEKTKPGARLAARSRTITCPKTASDCLVALRPPISADRARHRMGPLDRPEPSATTSTHSPTSPSPATRTRTASSPSGGSTPLLLSGTGTPPPGLQATVLAWDRDRAAPHLDTPHPRGPQHRQPAAVSATSLSPNRTWGTSSTSRPTPRAWDHYRAMYDLDERIGDTVGSGHGRQQTRRRLPARAGAAGPRPGRALAPAQPRPEISPGPNRLRRRPRQPRHRRPRAIPRRPRPAGRPAQVLLKYIRHRSP